MLKEINLPESRFSDPKIEGLRRVNYIFGKNGTGKSTITRDIYEQQNEEFNVQIFQGFSNIIAENKELNAISLGEQNTDITKKITKLKEEIKSLADEAILASEKEARMKRILEQKKRVRAEFCRGEAKKINGRCYVDKTLNGKHILDYEIDDQHKLNGDELDKVKKSISLEKKAPLSKPFSNTFDLDAIIQKLKEICEREVGREVSISINRTAENWVETGIELHKTVQSEEDVCLFCGQLMPADRLRELGNYFNKEILQVDSNLNELRDLVEKVRKILDDFTPYEAGDTYPDFIKPLNDLNEICLQFINNLCTALNYIEEKIEEKNLNKFDRVECDFNFELNPKKVDDAFRSLNDRMAHYSENIKINEDKARRSYQKHLIREVVTSKQFIDLNAEYNSQNTLFENCEGEIEHKREAKKTKEEKLEELINEYSNEDIAVQNINKGLSGLGMDAFRLKYTDNDAEGQYRIESNNGEIRSVNELSTGEKNIIAFLWFINKLNVYSVDERGKIIIFDDVVDSNDAASQYLVISQLQNLIKSTETAQIFILTHNIHFYMQLKPTSPQYKDKPNKTGNLKLSREAFFKFQKAGDKTQVVKITSSKQDVSTIYDELWSDLIFAKSNQRINLMFNTMRRILESYSKFIFGVGKLAELNEKIEKNTGSIDDSVIYSAKLKLLHVNSHVGYETDSDLNDIQPEKLYEAFKQIFYDLGESSKEHFNHYSCEAEKNYN
ncbi:AAA family ATPase [Weissella viridescens]|uniref:AAA family ATPase n=1 Tax=Weissella viridescens TaxID=1629 RepID=UPI0017478C17|nr:AAA family ATPase [Weissella viridescens]QOD85566.1 AAA family ATPase [Weissella viridescens]WJI90678.1 AAA family ATPase [Weissella viridescens]